MTIICPHCGEDFDVKENGRYICPACEECVDVDDWFDTPHVMQPDGVTCGWATTKWLLSAFGLEVPSDRQLERELHVRKGRGIRALDRHREVQGQDPRDGSGETRLHVLPAARSNPEQANRRFLHDRIREIVKRGDAATRRLGDILGVQSKNIKACEMKWGKPFRAVSRRRPGRPFSACGRRRPRRFRLSAAGRRISRPVRPACRVRRARTSS